MLEANAFASIFIGQLSLSALELTGSIPLINLQKTLTPGLATHHLSPLLLCDTKDSQTPTSSRHQTLFSIKISSTHFKTTQAL
jgi:hypothetical protein